MVSSIRQQNNLAYTSDVSGDLPVADKPEAETVEAGAVQNKEISTDSDSFEVATSGTEKSAATSAAAGVAAPAAPKVKKQGAVSKLWDQGMKALIPLTKKEIEVKVDETIKFDDAEKYKLDINANVDLSVGDKALTNDQKAYFAAHPGSMLLQSKLSVDLKASATSPCYAIESGTLMSGMSIEVQMPASIDPKSTPTNQVFTTLWDRLKSTTLQLPYTAKMAEKLPQGTVVTTSFVVAGGISLSAEDQTAEIDRRTQVTVSMERGADGKIQLTVTKQRVDEHALDLDSKDLVDHFRAGYERHSKVDRTTVEVYNIDLNNADQMAALQKALPWTGGKHKLIPGMDTSKLQQLGCEDKEKATEVKQREFKDKLDLSGDLDAFTGAVQISRKYEKGAYTITNMVDVKYNQDVDKEKNVGVSRTCTVVLPDANAKLSPKQATGTATRLSQCNAEAWRTAPEGTKVTELVTASLDLTFSGDVDQKNTDWQLDPSGKSAYTFEIVQTKDGPTVTVIEQDKLALLASLKGTNIEGSELCDQIKQFGIYEALEDFLQNDGKKLKQKYYNSYDTIKDQLANLVSEQLSYNYRVSVGGGKEDLHQVTFGPFALGNVQQKDAFRSLTIDLNMQSAIEQGLLQKVVSGRKLNGSVGGIINNYNGSISGSKDKKRNVEITHGEGQKLTITVTDTKIKTGEIGAGVNNVFGTSLEESDISYSGSRTTNNTEVKVYQLDLSNPAHKAAWDAAVAGGQYADEGFQLNFTDIDALNVRDPDLEKVTLNKIYAGTVNVKVADGPVSSTMTFGHNFRDGIHTMTSVVGFKTDLWSEGEDDKKQSAGVGVNGTAKVIIPDAEAKLSNAQVYKLSSQLTDFNPAAWQSTAVGSKIEIVLGNALEASLKGEFNTADIDKSSLWTVDPKGEYLTTIQIEQTEKGPQITYIKELKADILASFKHTRASEDLSVSDAIASFGLYNALEDFLQNDGKKLKAKYGSSKYTAISDELTALIKDQKAKNVGFGLTGGRDKAASTTFGPFDLTDTKEQELFTKIANGKLSLGIEAGKLLSVSSRKRSEAGLTADYNANDGLAKGAWEKDFKVDFQKNEDGSISLVVTETRLTDSETGLKLPDIIESVDVKFNHTVKNKNTQIYVYDLDLSNPAHQAALQNCLDKIDHHKNPEKALEAVAALGVRNPDKEKVIKNSDVNGELGLDAKRSALGAAFTLTRTHKDGKYNFTNLLDVKQEWDDIGKLSIGNIANLSVGFNVLATHKVDVAIPDGSGSMTMAEATALSTKLTLTNEDVWKDVPIGTAVTRMVTGEISVDGEAGVGKELSLMDGLSLSMKGGITINPSTKKIMGNTVTKTEKGLEVTVWQEDISKIALGIEAEAGLIVELSKFDVYNAVTDWLQGGEGLRKKLGDAAYKAADKALSKLLSNYLQASLTLKVSTSKENKETATFGPFELEDDTQKSAFNKMVRFFSTGEAMKAGMLQTKQVDHSKVRTADMELKLSALKFASHSELRRTESDFTIKTDSGEILTFSAYRAKYNKTGKNAFKGEEFTYNWDTFAVQKTNDGDAKLLDIIFQGSLTMKDKRTMRNEAEDWQTFCNVLNLTVTDDHTGKYKGMSGYGKGDGKIQFGASIGAFTDNLKDWKPNDVRSNYLKVVSQFENVAIPDSEVDRSAYAMPLDSNALRLAKDFNRTSAKKRSRIEEQFKTMYPNSKFTLEQLAKASTILEEYWTTGSDSRREELSKAYTELTGVANPRNDINLYLASYLITSYADNQYRMDQEDLQLYESQYERLTGGRQLYQDVEIVERADLFMTRMNEIHDDWKKAGGGEATAAMNEIVSGITDFGRKIKPWNLELGRDHEHNMFINMAAFLNLVGQNNNAVEVSYNGQRFNLAAHGEAAVQTKSAEDLVNAAKKEALGE